MTTTITPSSGATVEIKIASFKESMDLKKAITAELAKTKIDFQLSLELDAEKLLPALLALDASEDVERALFICLGRCKYNGERITANTFESEEARADYYEVALECLRVNLSPFFKGLLSKLKESGLLQSTSDAPLA